MSAPDLEAVLGQLEDAEINAWVGTAPPSHIEAAVHDPATGRNIRKGFAKIDGQWPRGTIAAWLLETARQHYPGRI